MYGCDMQKNNQVPVGTQISVNLLILVTGSVAAVKLGLLLDELETELCHIRIAATKSAFHFLQRAQPSRIGIPFKSILGDEKEWDEWQGMDDVVVHIELRRWSDLVVLFPLDANSLGKIANGLCDNLVTCVMRAWEVKKKPVIICPAMNTSMWMHPVTSKQIEELREWYSACPAAEAENVTPHSLSTEAETPLPDTLEKAMFQVLGPVCKRLACGDIGIGGMASVEDIARAIRNTMALLREKKSHGGGSAT